MHEYIFDGKIHPLSEDFAYVTEKLQEDKSSLEMMELRKRLLTEYVKYLIKNDPEQCIDILLNNCSFTDFSDKFAFIHRPSWIYGALSQYATFSLKFKRVKNDGLT